MGFDKDNPSPAYTSIVEDGRKFHKRARTWSGGLAVRHVVRIKNMIDRIGAKSVLDYGCGKGLQYMVTPEGTGGMMVEDYWGVPVYKYDPAVPADWRDSRIGRNKFAGLPEVKVHQTLPEGQTWDMMVCTHVLGCIPVVDLHGWVVPLFHKIIKKGMYFAENMAQGTKNVVKDKADKASLANDWTPQKWVEAVTPKDGNLDVEFWFRGHGDGGARFEKWPFHGTDQ